MLGSLARRSFVLALFVALAAVARPAAAVPTTYQYTGNPFTTFALGLYSATDSVSITITLDHTLVPGLSNANLIGNVLSYSFSDGVQTISDTTPGAVLEFFNAIDTDVSGNIVGWNANVEISGGDFFINSIDFLWDEGCFTGVSFCDSSGRVASNPGTWSVVPEPALPVLLSATAMAAVVGSRLPRRRRSTRRRR